MRQGPAEKRTKVYVVGATLDELRGVLRHRRDAFDPLAYFGFDQMRGAARLLSAEKAGADAAYYAQELQERLTELGLPVLVTASLAEAERALAHEGGEDDNAAE